MTLHTSESLGKIRWFHQVKAWLYGGPRQKELQRQLALMPLEDRIVPDGSLPQLIGLQLRDDTGASNIDRITWDPAVVGTVTNDGDGSLFGVGVEVDIDEDGIADDRIDLDFDGTILYDRRPSAVGDQVYSFRTFEWNSPTGEYLYGPWSNPEFEFEYTHPPISLPVISEFVLARDTGMPSDGITFDPTLTGTVTDPDGTDGLRIEYDLNGDGIADGTTNASTSGKFSIESLHNSSYCRWTNFCSHWAVA